MDFKLRKNYIILRKIISLVYIDFTSGKNEYKFSNLIVSIKREINDVLRREEICCIEVSKGDNSLQIIGDGYVSEDVLKQLNGYQLETELVNQLQTINEPKQPPIWLSKFCLKKSGQIWRVIFMMVYYKTRYACLEIRGIS